jgi:hypothetical protein
LFLGQPDQWTAKQCAERERIAAIGKHPRERDEVLNLLAPEQPLAGLSRDRNAAPLQRFFIAPKIASRAAGFVQVPDTLALLAWTFKDSLLARIDAEVMAEADDAAALSIAERQRQEAVVQSDLLDVERQESSLVWRAGRRPTGRASRRCQPARRAERQARDRSACGPVAGVVEGNVLPVGSGRRAMN